MIPVDFEIVYQYFNATYYFIFQYEVLFGGQNVNFMHLHFIFEAVFIHLFI